MNPTIPEKLDIEMPNAKAAREKERVDLFLKELEELQKKWKVELKLVLNYTPTNIHPVVNVVPIQDKLEEQHDHPST